MQVETEVQTNGGTPVHKLTVGEFLSEVVPGFMEIMLVPMNGKLGYNISKNWKFLQKLQGKIHDMNNVEIKNYVHTNPDGSVRLSVKEGDSRMSPDYLSDEKRKEYFDWYNKFCEQTEVELEFFAIDVEELTAINGLKPSTVTSLSYMFHE